MARVNLYLVARAGAAQALQAGALALQDCAPVQEGSVQLCVMRPREDDILRVGAGDGRLEQLTLAIEFECVPGVPLSSFQGAFVEAISPLLVSVDAEQSRLGVSHQKVFQLRGRKPVRYHYLMERRADFSHADYLDYYANHHCRFGLASPLADYLQNYVEPVTTQALANQLGLAPLTASSVSELRFDDVEAYLYSPPVLAIVEAAAEDEASFVDRDLSVSFSMNVLLQTGA